MDEYQRVTPTAQDDHGDSDGELSYSDHHHHPRQSMTVDGASTPPPPRRHHRTNTSRGSYTSVIDEPTIEDVQYDDDDEEEDTHHIADLYDDGENSPLHRSREGEDAEDAEKEVKQSTRSVSILFGSDDSDDDDEDDEYEEQLKRYSLDFRQTASSSTTISSSQNHSPWAKLQQARQKARQRRAEYLLQQSDRHTCRQSVYLFLVMTLCDATDAGIALVAMGFVAWFLMIWKVPDHRSLVVWGGLVVWSIRLGARPARQFLIQRRVRRHQQEERERRRTFSEGGYDVGRHGMMSPPNPSVFPIRRFEDTSSSSSGNISFATKPASSMELSAVSERGTSHRLGNHGRSSSNGGSDTESSSVPHFLL